VKRRRRRKIISNRSVGTGGNVAAATASLAAGAITAEIEAVSTQEYATTILYMS
jgi:hypothetical protein